MNVVFFDMATAGKAELASAVDAVYGHEVTALHLHDSTKIPFESYKTNNGKYDINFPWLQTLGDFTPFGATEVSGASYVNDFPGHLDYRPTDIMNVHATTAGQARADFVPQLPESYLDDDRQVIVPLAELKGKGLEVSSITLNAGDILCFCGGAVAHQFTSQSRSRRSYIRNFRRT